MSCDEKNFRLQNRKLHLTYKGHLDPATWLSWAKNVKKLHVEFYSIVHETGSDSYEHTHILLDAGNKNKFSTTSSRFFDWKDPISREIIHPNIQKITTMKHWTNSVTYHYKENTPYTNIEKPEDCKAVIENIWKCDNVSNAILTTCKTLKEVGGVIAAFNCKPSDYGIEPEVTWNQWQGELFEELKQPPGDRLINWNFDPTGGNGKTYFAKHMGMYRKAFVSTKANIYHTATAIDEFIKKNGNTVLVVIFNFTRQQECHNVYQALEELKDGMVTSEKYKGSTIYFNSPHVVVFANYLPEVKNLSIDRWDIRAISNEKVVKRYVAGKIVYEEDITDPYMSMSLKGLEDQFSLMGIHPIVHKPFTPLTQIPLPMPTPAPLNIKTGGRLASLDVPPAAPQKILSSTGIWKDGLFIVKEDPPPDTKIEVEAIIGNKKFIGQWRRGIFYPIINQ